ncbi:MAG: HAMP domain-containing histidine kinase [Candidatus Dormibacteraeota bacterium]|uniref:histidine kinase n=1 Tax=Candidatus Aeolococcus gillhamiae TaxID=3127015 RepID=A0A934JXX9_9BACT|nr:HAMP domain-containing histidine kinase [Candidatus Dormibacteraeota bacterium]
MGATTRAHPARWRRLAGLWSRRRLTTRLLAVYALGFGLAMASMLLVASLLFGQTLISGVDASLNEEANEFQSRASQRPPGQGLDAFAVQYLQTRQLAVGEAILVDVRGARDIGTPGAAALETTAPVQAWLAQPPPAGTVVTSTAADTSYRLLAIPLSIKGARVGVLIIGRTLGTIQSELATVQLLVVAQGAFALAIALIGGHVILRRVLTTVRTTTETADRISRERLDLRLGDSAAGDEVGMLARSFNEMLDRLDTAFRSQSQLLADVSHQVRTPITVIRGHLEVLQRGGYRDEAEVSDTISLVLDEATHAGLLIDRLLLLGRAFDADSMDLAAVELPSFLAEIVDAARVLGERHWELGATPDCVLMVDRVKLRSAILNLVENAVKATTSGDTVTIGARLDDALTISVTDSGKGMTPDELGRAFERFRASAGTGHGTGLGLVIVKAVAEAHRGRVAIDSAPNAGCVVSIVLPRSCVMVAAPRTAAP